MSQSINDMFVACPISGAGDQGAAETQTVDGVLCLATSTSSQRIVLPPLWRGRELEVSAVGLDIDILFGGSSVSVTVNQVSTVSSEVVTLNAASGDTVFAGTSKIYSHVKASGQYYFAFRSSGATGFLKVRPADRRHAAGQ
jgi:hypothetical protein